MNEGTYSLSLTKKAGYIESDSERIPRSLLRG
jgi:hypothetical protein